MAVRNDIDRFHLAVDVINRVPSPGERGAAVRQHMIDQRNFQRRCAYAHGEDPPELRDWTWPG